MPSGRQGLLAEVESVVVREADAVDPQASERLSRRCGSPKKEDLAGCRPPGSPLGDATLQVHDEQVGLVGDLHDLGVKQRLGRGRGQSVRHVTLRGRLGVTVLGAGISAGATQTRGLATAACRGSPGGRTGGSMRAARGWPGREGEPIIVAIEIGIGPRAG